MRTASRAARQGSLPVWLLASLTAALAVASLVGFRADASSAVRIGISFPGDAPQSGLGTLVEHLTTQRLVSVGADGRAQPQLAERWSRSADGRTWIFSIPPNLTFHDGSPATTSAIATLIRQALADPLERLNRSHLSDVNRVEAAGQRQIVLRTGSGRILLLDDLGDTPLGWRDPKRGLGPYVLESLVDESARLRAFKFYFKGRPAVGRLELHSFPSQRAAWAALMRGEIDALHEISRDAAEFVEQGERVRTYPSLRPYVAGMAFNVRGVLRDPSVRRALSLAIDRAAIVKSAYRGRAQVAEGPLWPGHWTLSPELPRLTFDRAAALTGMARAGQLNTPGQGMRAKLKLRCLVAPLLETQPFERLALLLQKQLYDVGVDLQFEPVTLPTLVARLRSGDFDAVLLEYLALTPTWVSRIWRSPTPGGTPLMNTGYTAADEALDAMQLATSEEELKRAVAAVYRKMYDDPPAIFIAWPEVARAVTTDFDVPLERGTDIMGSNIWFWRPATSAPLASSR